MQKIISEDGEVLDVVVRKAIPAEAPFWKTPYNHDRDAESLATATFIKEPTKTQQHLAAEADINNILRKFQQTGELPPMGVPQYLDIENEFDLQDNMVTAHQVNEAWEKLPEAAKDLLGTPERFTNYVESALQRGDLAALERVGLVKRKEAPAAPTSPERGTPAPTGEKAAPAA